MGESVNATIDVMDTKVHLKVLLPGMLGMFAGMIQAALQKKGSVLLEDHSKWLVIAGACERSRALDCFAIARNEEEATCGISRWSVRVLRASTPPRRWRRPMAAQARIDILDRYPVPYGLIRFGVAPDHQSLKAVSKRYDKVAESAGVDFIGNVTVGRDVSVAELLDLYDAVILATGAPHDRKLGIPGEDLPGVVGSAEFVGWYNGHPEFADLDPLARRHACRGRRQRQCRARLRAHPVQDARTSSKGPTSSATRSTRSTSPRSAPSPSSAAAARTRSR